MLLLRYLHDVHVLLLRYLHDVYKKIPGHASQRSPVGMSKKCVVCFQSGTSSMCGENMPVSVVCWRLRRSCSSSRSVSDLWKAR